MSFPGLFSSTWYGWTRRLLFLSAGAGTHLIRHYLMLSLRAFSAWQGAGIQITKQTKRKEEKKKRQNSQALCLWHTKLFSLEPSLFSESNCLAFQERPKVKFSLGRKLFCLMACVCLNSSVEGRSHKTLKRQASNPGFGSQHCCPGEMFLLVEAWQWIEHVIASCHWTASRLAMVPSSASQQWSSFKGQFVPLSPRKVSSLSPWLCAALHKSPKG